MRCYLLALLLLGSCAWKQRDFEKDLDRSGPEAAPQVEVDKKLMEQFEVKPVEEPLEAKAPEKIEPKKSGKVSKKITPKVTPKKVPVKSAAAQPKVVKPVYPADYPANFHELNASAKKVWDLYKPNHPVNEKVYLNINYLGMTVGKIMFTNLGKKMMNGREVWHFHARFKSAPFYSNIYELDDTVDTYVTTENFLSVRYSLIQRESKQDVDDLQLYDHEKLKAFWFYKQKKSNGDVKDKQTETYLPYFSVDPFSVLFLYQGLPLKDGDVYDIPVLSKNKILILKSVVEGREKIATDNGKKNAIRVHATTQYSGDHLKSGNLYFWFSDDEKRTLLKAQAKIKIGSVTAEIVED